MKQILRFGVFLLFAILPLAAYSQTVPKSAPQAKASDEKAAEDQKDLAQRREFAASQVTRE